MRLGGKNIREICATVERLGPCTSRQVAEAVPHLAYKAVRTYCSRATDYGMLIRLEGKYSAVPGWMEIVEARAPKPVKVRIKPFEQPLTTSIGIYPNGPMPIASAWDFGDRAARTNTASPFAGLFA